MERVKRDIRVAVLAGGASSEREISLNSGKNAQAALCEAGYEHVDLLDPAQDGFLDSIRSGYDVAFLALHGAGGEDGQIQHVLAYLGIPYTGSDAAASVLAADKELSKVMYERAGIPVAAGVALERDEVYDVNAIARVVGEHSFVKPAINGSSYGVSKVDDPSLLGAAIARAFEYGEKVLVEECLVGTEITVGVYEDGDLKALPVVEIRCPEDADFYNLDVKYVDPADIHRIPAQIDPEDYARAQELACAAHRALGCYGLSRSDFIVTDRGPVILETNTLPGMTDTSLYPDEIRHEGMVFSDVCDALIAGALARAGRMDTVRA